MAVHLGKIQCLRLFPEVACFTRIEQPTTSAGNSRNNGASEGDAGSTAAATAWENHKREQRAYVHLANALLSANSTYTAAKELVPGSAAAAAVLENFKRDPTAYVHLAHALLFRNTKSCIARCIGASSTDNFPNERIENTLESQDHVYIGPQDELMLFAQENHFDFEPGEHMYHWPVYWSSTGQEDPGVPEFLVYKLSSDLCIVDEIKIQPFRAFFQPHKPIYSAQYVRFKFGCSKLPVQPEDLKSFNYDEEQMIADDNSVWTYTSPEFPMLQENVLQSFKLPRPVLCIGGVVRVELLGRIQKQEVDDLYYICINYVQVLGTPLSREFGAGPCENGIALKYLPDHDSPGDSGCSGSKWHEFEARIWRSLKATSQGIGFNQELLSRLLGSLQLAVEENGHGESKDVTRPLP